MPSPLRQSRFKARAKLGGCSMPQISSHSSGAARRGSTASATPLPGCASFVRRSARIGRPPEESENRAVAHAAHFLSRLKRVSLEQTELALALYRDPSLVRSALAGASLPPGAEHVAIALDEREPSPHLIVTRSGRFVTCLGRGMRPHDAAPLSRAELDRQCEGVEEYRAALKRSRELDAESLRLTSLLRSLLELGPHLPREDFELLWALQPLFAAELPQALLELSSRAELGGPVLARLCSRGVERVRGPDLARVREAWGATHAVGHLSLLLGHRGDLLHLLPEFFSRAELSWSWTAFKTNHAPVARQGLWLAAQSGPAGLDHFRRRLGAAESSLEALDAAMAMAVIALAHAEVRPAVEAELAGWARAAKPEDARRVGPAAGNALQLFRVVEQLGGAGAPIDVDALPLSASARAALGPELAVTAALAAQRPVADERSNHFAAFLLSAVALPRAKPEDFFFPRAALRPEALAFDPQWPLASYRALRSIFPAAPSHRERRQARPNEPCPCGSGLKFKRCCGRSQPG